MRVGHGFPVCTVQEKYSATHTHGYLITHASDVETRYKDQKIVRVNQTLLEALESRLQIKELYVTESSSCCVRAWCCACVRYKVHHSPCS